MRRALSGISLLFFTLLLVPELSAASVPRLSGNTTVNLSAIPLPCSLVQEIKGDTRCERTIFSWDLDLAMNFKLAFPDGQELWLDATGGFAGFEHVVFGADAELGEVAVRSELWLAVPFESVLDVNNLPNSAIIPPGDMLFAAAQVQASWQAAGFRFSWFTVFQDLNFPNPGSDFGPLHYGLQSQSFALGSLVRISTTIAGELGLSMQFGLGAEPGGFSIKGHSTSVRAAPGRLFARISLSGLRLGCPWCGGTGMPSDDIRIGLGFAFEPKRDTFLRITGSVSTEFWETARVSTSFSIVVPNGIEWGGFSVSVKTPVGTLNMHFDPHGEFQSGTLGMGYRTQLNLGWTSGMFFVRATATTQHGVSSVSASLSLSQGTFSSSYNLSYSYQGDRGLAFSSFSMRYRLNLNPLQVGVNLVFGRWGLGRFTVSTGYTF